MKNQSKLWEVMQLPHAGCNLAKAMPHIGTSICLFGKFRLLLKYSTNAKRDCAGFLEAGGKMANGKLKLIISEPFYPEIVRKRIELQIKKKK
jgi:hypothetical protein